MSKTTAVGEGTSIPKPSTKERKLAGWKRAFAVKKLIRANQGRSGPLQGPGLPKSPLSPAGHQGIRPYQTTLRSMNREVPPCRASTTPNCGG